MFIALHCYSFALLRSAMCCGDSVYMPLLTERNNQELRGYKHVAPLEQEPGINKHDFRANLIHYGVGVPELSAIFSWKEFSRLIPVLFQTICHVLCTQFDGLS